MKKYIQEAESLRLLLNFGFINGQDVITWADETIVAEADIDDNLIELSSLPSEKSADISSRLSQVAVPADKIAALRSALGRIYTASANNEPDDLAALAAGLSDLAGEYDNLPGDLSFLKNAGASLSTARDKSPADFAAAGKKFLENLQASSK